MNWREHSGGACPTDEKARVVLRYRGVEGPFESRFDYAAGRVRWSHKGEVGDVIAYAVIGIPGDED